MNEVNIFLNVLKKFGYPNSEVPSLAEMVGYNLEYFLADLYEEIGQEGVDDFCRKALGKIGADQGMKVEFGNEEYVVVVVENVGYDIEETRDDVLGTLKILDSKLESVDEDGNVTYKTLDEITDETDMGEWSELDELINVVRQEVYNHIYRNCGFGVWWE